MINFKFSLLMPKSHRFISTLLIVLTGVCFHSFAWGWRAGDGVVTVLSTDLDPAKDIVGSLPKPVATASDWRCFNLTDRDVYVLVEGGTLAKVSPGGGLLLARREAEQAAESSSRFAVGEFDINQSNWASISSYVVPVGGDVFYGKFVSPAEGAAIIKRLADRVQASVSKQLDDTDPTAATAQRLLSKRLASGNATKFGEPVRFADSLIKAREGAVEIVSGACISIVRGEEAIAFDESSAAYRWIKAGNFIRATKNPTSKTRSIDLANGFWCAITELTQGQHRYWQGRPTGTSPMQDFPQAEIHWDKCEKLVKDLTKKLSRTYDLPTEAEWEYVAQAGRLREFGANLAPEALGWFSTNSGMRAHKVATLAPSDWGTYDMHGNLREWCKDWFSLTLPEGVDPVGPQRGTERVVRGGSFQWSPKECRSGSRDCSEPQNSAEYLGVRLVVRPSLSK